MRGAFIGRLYAPNTNGKALQPRNKTPATKGLLLKVAVWGSGGRSYLSLLSKMPNLANQ